ncbi:MAG: prepilin peptidase [Lachnospiraceae bacterium]|nr:prepilin peptidase [Lachnospiraceae bacterium]
MQTGFISILPVLITAGWLGIAAWYDIRKKALPLLLVVVFLLLAVIWDAVLIMKGEAVLYERILAFLPGIFFLALSLMSSDKVGLGDGLSMIGAGQFAGAAGIFCTMCAAILLCAVYALILLAAGKASPKRRIAFIPFLLAGFIIVLSFGGGAQ